MGNEATKTHCSNKDLQCKQLVMKEDSDKELHCKQWVIKQGRLIVHTRVTMQTIGNEARKTHCSHKELQCNNG
ncbi:hypothetical protein KSS87_019296 [Heliosperma pusillum]|nr:hypothetical protein KSS87_019296 [Heliosperma pusillum]